MLITDLVSYAQTRNGLVKIIPTCVLSDITDEFMYVSKTKEEYNFGSEEEADELIDRARQEIGFVSAKKKFKQGKIKANGDVVKADMYIVVIEQEHA